MNILKGTLIGVCMVLFLGCCGKSTELPVYKMLREATPLAESVQVEITAFYSGISNEKAGESYKSYPDVAFSKKSNDMKRYLIGTSNFVSKQKFSNEVLKEIARAKGANQVLLYENNIISSMPNAPTSFEYRINFFFVNAP